MYKYEEVLLSQIKTMDYVKTEYGEEGNWVEGTVGVISPAPYLGHIKFDITTPSGRILVMCGNESGKIFRRIM